MTPQSLFDLTGKVALVTGGSSGIGRMATEGLASAGARVLIASRKGDACAAVSAEVNALGLPGSVEGFAGDVSSQAGVDALAAEVAKRTDKLHILMNNAGRTWGAPLGEFPWEGWDKVNDLNLTGMFQLTQALLPMLAATATDDDPSRIVNTGSVMGDVEKGGGAYSYAVSKAGVHHMTRILANELAERRITVNAIAPGPFKSKMTAFALTDAGQADRTADRVPLGRLGDPGDIAGALQYLCSRAGAYVTGAILPLSGGINVHSPGSLFAE
ncbi:SDR family oxidoreductase [Maritimibacter sp. DP1N21-5]|uniref:SDR family oxidoreductase n=1 Tax=Maritimibacter sp. DP1N21-5 TaxID=2836867 RepID=UPI001C478E2C|nr:SDR family oxidoreductase [Maritimibacter sp. DP1N21-5]MBV7407649.1 SDR family oxidoreductase [Maritimibacter sp. DP1N21-5]